MTTLLFTAGPLAGQRIELAAELVLGREGANLLIGDPELSRRHAVLRPSGAGVEIEDLGSLNGTWVNGARIAGRTQLVPGDRVRLGVTELRLETDPGSGSGAPAVPGAADRQAATIAAEAAAAAWTSLTMPSAGGERPAAGWRSPTVLTFAIVAATALALLVYFLAR